ncbi:MAG: cobaltochelatase subunit CobN [Thermoplasmatales archaeon]|nr:cobaltochelatase subunit CobN [Thermoplasmatales archaeon]
MKLAYISIQSFDANAMAAPAKAAAEELGVDLEILCLNSADAEDVLVYRELVERTAEADLVLMRCMTEPSRATWFGKYERHLKEAKGLVMVYSGSPDVRFAFRDYFKGTDEEFLELSAYVANRGAENDRGIIHWLNRYLTGEGDVPDPVKQREDGIYHPDFPRDVALEDYLGALDRTRPCVGIMFTSNIWIYENTAAIDMLVRELESNGMSTIPVFYSLSTAKDGSSKGALGIVERYFLESGRPMIDVLVSTSPFSHLMNSRDGDGGIRTDDDDNFYRNVLGMPVINVTNLVGHYPDYEELATTDAKEFPVSLFWPEVDGQIISVPISSVEGPRGMVRLYSGIADRIARVARFAKGWARLRAKPPSERKVAILVYQHRPETAKLGSAAGLDTIESVADMLKALDSAGYRVEGVPEDGRALVDEMLAAVTNNLEWCDSHHIREKSAHLMPMGEYLPHFESIPRFNRDGIAETWGDPPGPIMTEGGSMIIPGLVKGNVYVGYQPPRGRFDMAEQLLHDPALAITHQYLAFYRWIRDVFGADAVVHVGTHGTLEWLPGRSATLSGTCYPDVAMDSIPHLYPYIIDDPGEGIQAKRRSEAVLLGHMCPTMARAGNYEETSAIEVPMQQYFSMRGRISEDRKGKLLEQMYDACVEISIFDDLGLTDSVKSPADLEGHLDKLHDYLFDVKDSIVRDGLHIFGRPPEGERMLESVYSLSRLRNGTIPSLRDSVGSAMGLDARALAEDPSGRLPDGTVNSVALEEIDAATMGLIRAMGEKGFDPTECRALAEATVGANAELGKAVGYICDELVPNLLAMTDEMDNFLVGLDGGYVPPGPSGAPTRGCAHILPMGRNYYGVDPEAVPTRAAWETGKEMAEQMISRHVEEKGEYPLEIGFIVWATDTMKTGGDDTAYILWLMGVRPTWSETGDHVTGLEVVPLEELGRPRLDVTVRITGLFRDAFPNLVNMIDDAVDMVANLDESDGDNRLAANLRKDIVSYLRKGIPETEAHRMASARVFGCPPGAYGAGVNNAIENGAWQTVQDLADIYITWGSHAYGRGLDGVSMRDEFIERFGRVGVTIKNMPDREIDMLDTDDVYAYLGGLNAFVRAYGRADAVSYIGDSSNPDRVRTRDAAEECKFLFRSKLLNPKFIGGLKQHGFRGAAEIAKLTEHVFGWDATSDIVEGWMYEGIADRFLFDDETREWMKEQNPDALRDTASRLLEAMDRGMWDCDPETRKRIEDVYMDAEAHLEFVTDRS